MVAAILCWATQQSVDDVLAIVKSKRSMADPNNNFVNQLKQFEKLGYFAKDGMQIKIYDCTGCPPKLYLLLFFKFLDFQCT